MANADRCALKSLEIPAGLDVMKEGKPFFFEGGKTGCLLIHGFTGTTSSMKPMGEYMAGKGLTVLGPRLPGHGTDTDDMGKFNYTDWTSTVETAFSEISEMCDKVFVSGLSMGGLLTLYLAERHSDSITGAIPICAPVHWLAEGGQALALKIVPALKHVVKKIPGPGNDLKDPDVVEVAYEKLHTNALHGLIKLAKVVDGDLSRITCPIRIFEAREDHVVPPKNAPYILDHVSSYNKELVWLDNCYHVATLDLDKKKIFEASYNFMIQVG